MQWELPEGAKRVMEPPGAVTVSRWCDLYRVLDAKDGSRPGRWETAWTPYLREPLDAFTDPGVGTIVFMKCSRVGGTEWVNNLIGYTADVRPMPVMYVQPQRGDIEDEFKGRLKRMIEGSERLYRHVPEGEWAGKHRIVLDTLTIHGAWAENPRTMIRKTIGVAAFDEIDNCERAAGGLGNTLALLAERLVTFGHRGKLVLPGTPTIADGSGWRMLQRSDCRRPHVPCPLCGTYQVLLFDRIKLRPGHEGERDPDAIEIGQLAGYECEGCGELLEHKRWHRWMIDRVVWVPKAQRVAECLPTPAPGMGALTPAEVEIRERLSKACGEHEQWKPAVEGEAPVTRVRGYWINVLYSPWEGRDWSAILAEFLRVKGHPDKLRVFMNSWLAEAWEDAQESTTADELREKVKIGGPADVVPSAARVLLAEADVQATHVEYTIRAWGAREESWLVREGTCETLEQLYALAFWTGYEVAGVPGLRMRCMHLVVDTAHRKDEVLTFSRRPGVVPIWGQAGERVLYRTRPTKIEYWPLGGTRPDSQVVQLVNVDLFKAKLYRLLKVKDLPGEPGAFHLHRETSEEYLRQVSAWHQVRERTSARPGAPRRLVWRTKVDGAADHRGDCEVYGLALAELAGVPLFNEETPRLGVMDGDELKRAETAKAALRGEGSVPATVKGREEVGKPVGKRPTPRRRGRRGGLGGFV